MKIDTDLLVDGLHALSGARSQGPQQMETTANLVLTKTLEALKDIRSLSPLDFSLLANLHTELRSLVHPKKAVSFGVNVLDARPDIKDELPADHFQKLGALFSAVVSDAVKHRVVTDAAAHAFSEVFKTSFSKISLEHQRPYLVDSRRISWAGRSALTTPRGVKLVLKGFMGNARLTRHSSDLSQNQALLAVVENIFSKGVRKLDAEKCMKGGESQAEFDHFVSILIGWSKAGITFRMAPLDILSVSQLLELMATVIEKEQGTKRAVKVEASLHGLVAMVIPKTGKITAQTSDYVVKLEDHPLAEDGNELTSTQNYLLESLKTSKAMKLPQACEKALASYRMHVLLHAAAITPVLRESNPKYEGQVFIKELIKLSEETLGSASELNRLSEEGRSVVAMAVEDPTLRMQLAKKYLSVRRDMFVKDLGL